MNQQQMLTKLLDARDNGSYLITKAEAQQLEIWDLRERVLDGPDLRKLIEMYDKVFTYGVE